MKIIKLEAENFKRLTAVTIEPDGSLIVVGGKNGAGKSSTLDAIEAALGGKGSCPDVPIKSGKQKARVVVETEDLIVTRTFKTKGSSTLEVRSKEGGVVTSPQKMLDGLVGSLSFDPLAFSRDDPKKQAETLRALVGLDVTELDAAESGYRTDRTLMGREAKTAKALAAGLPYHADAPDEEVVIAELSVEIEARRKINRANHEQREILGDMRRQGSVLMADLGKAEAQVKQLEDEIAALKPKGVAFAAEVAELKDEDVDGLLDQLVGAEGANRKIRENEAHAKAGEDYAGKQAVYDELTAKIQQTAETRADALAKADYPIEGLGITEDGVELNGLPLQQASSAEQLRCSVAIGLASNPELRVMLIRDGSLLDENSLRLVAEMAEAADSQVWVERVGAGEECTVVISDGAISVDGGAS